MMMLQFTNKTRLFIFGYTYLMDALPLFYFHFFRVALHFCTLFGIDIIRECIRSERKHEDGRNGKNNNNVIRFNERKNNTLIICGKEVFRSSTHWNEFQYFVHCIRFDTQRTRSIRLRSS